MKTLFIIRHAKSSWDEEGLNDHERPLVEKGKKRTLKIADYLLSQKITVDLIISSDAVRARDTAYILALELSYPEKKIQLNSTVYNGDAESLADILLNLPDEINSMILVGHNPSVTALANFFLKKKIEWLPTSGVVGIEFETVKWAQISDAEKRTKFVVSPKMLRAN
jgi:phosphohistidine phosphatase